MQFGSLTLEQCRYGWMLFSGPFIGKCLELYGEYSESEVEAMRRFVRPGDVVVDIGANIGDLTVPLARTVGPSGRVYAVESHPEIFNILCANLALNQISNVRPINAFVRKSETTPIAPSFVGDMRDFKAVALDELCLDRCKLIKIDVDGNELDVLHSGAETIARCRPVLYLENDVPEKSKALLEHLLELNYELYWHIAPVFSPQNYRGNPVNHWGKGFVVSLMVLGVPKEMKVTVAGLAKIKNSDEWVLRGQLRDQAQIEAPLQAAG